MNFNHTCKVPFVCRIQYSQFPYLEWGHRGFPHSSVGKESTCNVGDLGSIPGLGRSPRERKGYPLQYSGLENSVHGVAKSQTWLSHFHFHLGEQRCYAYHREVTFLKNFIWICMFHSKQIHKELSLVELSSMKNCFKVCLCSFCFVSHQQ